MGSRLLALDVGGRRIGVAVAGHVARLASPLTTLENDASVWAHIREIVQREDADMIVVGLPRGMDGQETAQTAVIRDFVTELKNQMQIPVELQDESLTSVKAEEELGNAPHAKGDIDALAATYILEDYLAGHEVMHG